jgi:hypothetical protein
VIFVVSGAAAELVSALLEEFAAIQDELLEFVIPAPEPESPVSLLEEKLFDESFCEELLNRTSSDELDVNSAEVLFPSSPQADNPNATANTPKKA